MIQINHTTQQGFALLLTLVTVSAIITVTLSLVSLTLQQLELSVDARDSERAFHAASAGLECGQYYANRNYTSILSVTSSGDAVPNIHCMLESDAATVMFQSISGGDGELRTITYQLEPEIAGEETCLDITIYSIEAISANLTHDIGGQTGEVECDQSSVCTAVVSRGYDRTCSATPGPYEVARELNAIF